jgi:acyl carrier protein
VGWKRSQILGRIKILLNQLKIISNTDQIDEQSELLGQGVGLDSVEILNLVTRIEEEFDLLIDDDELLPEYFKSVGTLITFIEEKL